MKRGRKSQAELAALAQRPADLRASWQIEQGKRCGCGGGDDLCPCQNENPWPRPRRDWAGEVETLTKQQATDRETIANQIDQLADLSRRVEEAEKERDAARKHLNSEYHARKAAEAKLSTAKEALRPFAHARDHSGSRLEVADFDVALKTFKEIDR